MPSTDHYIVGFEHEQVLGEAPIEAGEPFTGLYRREQGTTYVEIPTDYMVFIPFLFQQRFRCDAALYDIRPPVPTIPRARLSISIYTTRIITGSSGLMVHAPFHREGIVYSDEITTGETMTAVFSSPITITPGIWWIGLIANRDSLDIYECEKGGLFTRQSKDLSLPNGGATYGGVVYGQEPEIILDGDANLTADQLGIYAHRLAFRNV